MGSKMYDVVVIGGGAAGLMCSATAGYQGLSVLVIDHAPKAAGKIRISGGGKCNFTNLSVSPNNYICQNPHFVKSALARYSSNDFIELMERHGLAYEQRDLGKLFCLNKASDLIQILRTECSWASVEFSLATTVEKVSFEKDLFHLKTQLSQEPILCKNLVVATGGLSFPKLKATDFGYQVAQSFGHQLVASRPGLVPLVYDDKWQAYWSELSGISLEMKVSLGDQSFQEAVLFTHHGLSGPAILQISNYWQQGQAITLNPLPDLDVFNWLLAQKQNNQKLSKALTEFWPKKMVLKWLQKYTDIDELSNVSDEKLKALASQLTNWKVYPADTAGYDKAEVTLGGIDTDQVSSKTFESTLQPRLYFIGEVLDVTGHLGGYNFQWAWSSGYACGLSLATC